MEKIREIFASKFIEKSTGNENKPWKKAINLWKQDFDEGFQGSGVTERFSFRSIDLSIARSIFLEQVSDKIILIAQKNCENWPITLNKILYHLNFIVLKWTPDPKTSFCSESSAWMAAQAEGIWNPLGILSHAKKTRGFRAMVMIKVTCSEVLRNGNVGKGVTKKNEWVYSASCV